MKKLLTLIALVISLTVSASDYSLKVVNNTPYKLDYLMFTTYFLDTPGTSTYPRYGMPALLTLGPYSTDTYDDPFNTGLPFYLVPTTWVYTPAFGVPPSVVNGTTAYIDNGEKQQWASIKFNVYGAYSFFSGHMGPFQAGLYGNNFGWNPLFPDVSITWIASGGHVTVIVNDFF